MGPVNPSKAPSRVPLRRLRAELAATLRQVAEGGEFVVVTRRGEPLVAVVPLAALATIDAAGALLARRALAAAAGLPDLASALADLGPPGAPARGPEGRPGGARPRRLGVPPGG